MKSVNEHTWSATELQQLPKLLSCGLGTITIASILAKSHSDVLNKLAGATLPQAILIPKFLATPYETFSELGRKRSIHAALVDGEVLGEIAEDHELPVDKLINLILDSNMLRKMSLDDVRASAVPSDENPATDNRAKLLANTPSEETHNMSSSKEDLTSNPAVFQNQMNIYALKSAWHSFRSEPSVEEKLKEWLSKHQITELFHFSPLENLGGILNQGLVTVLELKLSKSVFKANDHDRYDETGGICTSLGFPNYKLLYRAQLERALEPVILRIDPRALFIVPWIAVPTNAATREMRRFMRERSKDLIGIDALSRMYLEEVPISSESPARRSTLELPESFPTDPQAEVIFLERIPPYLIMSLCVPNDSMSEKVTQIVQREKRHLRVEKRADLYKSRKDFNFWSGGKRIRLENL